MDEELKRRFVRAMMRAKKIGGGFPAGFDLRFGEYVILKAIAKGEFGRGAGSSGFCEELSVTRPAVSQMLNVFERKNYITRRIDKTDRRKIEVSLTDEGKEILSEAGARADRLLNDIIERFGEDNMKRLVELLEKFIGVTELIKNESAENGKSDTKNKNGDEVN